jgi:hypothetical protein
MAAILPWCVSLMPVWKEIRDAPTVNVIKDLVCLTFIPSDSQVVHNPCYKVILERTFDSLV